MAAHCACAHWHMPHTRFTVTHNFPQTLAFRPTIDTRPQQPPCIPQTLRGREGRWIFRASSAEHRRRIQRIPCCFLGFSLLLSSALPPSFTSSPSTRHSSAHITIRSRSSVCPTQARRVPTRSSTSTWIRWTPSFARVFRPAAAFLAPRFHVLSMLSASHHRIAICTLSSPLARRNAQTFTCVLQSNSALTHTPNQATST